MKCDAAVLAAIIAGLSTGFYKDMAEIEANWQLEKSFQPLIGQTQREQLLKGWKRAVRCALAYAEEE